LGTLVSPQGLWIDANGALIVADAGAPAIYRFNLGTNTRTTVTSAVTAPTDAVTDAANNVLIADTTQITALPASSNGSSFIVAGLTPLALAIDGAGNLYTGQSGSVLELQRTNGYLQFSLQGSATQAVNMLESGNVAFTGTSFSQTDNSDYSFSVTDSTDCALSSAGLGTLAVGGVCALTATYTPTTYATTMDAITFNGNLTNAALSNPSTVELVLTGPATAPSATITLGSLSPASPVYGQTVTLSATVSGAALAPTGTVVFTVDTSTYSAAVTNGVATATVPGLSAGTHSQSASYTSNNGYTPATSATEMFTVAQATSSVTLSANPNPAAQGKADVLTATVASAGQPGGTVVFTSGTTTLCSAALNASGVAMCSFIPSTSGNLTVTAQYQGDANHVPSAATLTLTVYDASLTLQFSSTQLVYPGATNVTVCVTGATSATPSGMVMIEDGTTVLTTQTLQGNGCAYWYISPGLAAGSHSISAVYSGDKTNPGGTSTPTIITVSPVPVNMSVSCWNSSFAYGANYQCTVSASSNAGSAQGLITYSYDGGTPIAVPLSNGNAQFIIAKPPVGNQSVGVAYAQQANYAAASPQTENFVVTAAPVNVSLTPSTSRANIGTSVTFQVSVSSWSAGPPNNNGSVAFYDGATLLATVPINSMGQSSYTTSTLPSGSQTITATYSGGTNYASGSGSATITLTP